MIAKLMAVIFNLQLNAFLVSFFTFQIFTLQVHCKVHDKYTTQYKLLVN